MVTFMNSTGEKKSEEWSSKSVVHVVQEVRMKTRLAHRHQRILRAYLLEKISLSSSQQGKQCEASFALFSSAKQMTDKPRLATAVKWWGWVQDSGREEKMRQRE